MQETLTGPLFFFGASILFGGGLLMIYDMIRGFRRVFVHNSFWVTAEDFLFWIFVGISSFRFLFWYNKGELRGFFFLGLGLGMILYYFLGSSAVLAAAARIFGMIRHLFQILFGWMKIPVIRIRTNLKWRLKKEKKHVKMALKKGNKRGDADGIGKKNQRHGS